MTCPRGGSLEDGIRRHGREPESDCHKWPEGGPSFPMGKGFTQASLSRTLQWKGHVLLRPGLTASEGNTWEFKRLLSGIQSHFETNGSLGPRVHRIPWAWLPSSPSAKDSALDRMVWREVEPPSPRRQLGVSVAELCAMCTWATTCDVGQTEPGEGPCLSQQSERTASRRQDPHAAVSQRTHDTDGTPASSQSGKRNPRLLQEPRREETAPE